MVYNSRSPMLKRMATFLVLTLVLSLSLISCSDSDAPDGMKESEMTDVYEENTVDFTLFVPESWQVQMASGIVMAIHSEEDPASVSMTGFALSGETSVAEQWEAISAETKRSSSSFTLISQPNFDLEDDPAQITVCDTPAGVYTYTATIAAVTCQYRQVLFIQNGYLYLFTYTASPDTFDAHLADVEKILKEITFDKNASVPTGMKAAVQADNRFVESESYRFFVDEDWTTETTTGVFCARYGGSLPTTFTVMTAHLSEEDSNITVQEYFERYNEEFNASFKEFKLLAETKSTLKGSSGSKFAAVEYEYQVTVGDEGDASDLISSYRFAQVLCKNENEIYILTLSTTDNYYADHMEDFLKILENFEILES